MQIVLVDKYPVGDMDLIWKSISGKPVVVPTEWNDDKHCVTSLITAFPGSTSFMRDLELEPSLCKESELVVVAQRLVLRKLRVSRCIGVFVVPDSLCSMVVSGCTFLIKMHVHSRPIQSRFWCSTLGSRTQL